MNIERLKKRCQRLDQHRWWWYQRWCWFHSYNHDLDFEVGVALLLMVTESFLVCCLIIRFGASGERAIACVLMVLLVTLPAMTGGLMAITRLGRFIFDRLERLTESIHNCYERRTEQVSEQLTEAEKVAAEREALLDAWASVPDGAIMPVRLEAERADRGLSLAEQLQLP